MTKKKNLLSIMMTLILAVAMVVTMTAPTFAENKATDTTITVPNTDTHTYEVYQIFTGELSEGVLSNVEWGKNGTGTEGQAVDAAILKALQDANASGATNTSKLAVIEKYVNLNSKKFGTVSKDSQLTVKTGYYLLKDVDANIIGTDTFTKYVVQVVGPTTITRKADTPEMEKKVKEKNDSTGVTSDWQDASDYDIGDDVPYQISTKIVSNYADYEHYYLSFNDKMEAGLTFNNDVKVFVNGIEVNGFTTVIGEQAGDYTFVTSCLDITTLIYGEDNRKIKADDIITVTYSAKLNENAVIGSTGNKNTANMEFSNNPNSTGDGKTKPDNPGKTPDDTVITFTYKTVVNKVDQDGIALPRAGFTLYKYDDSTKDYVLVEKIGVSDATSFTFSGLDAGQYKLSETDTPPGYNTIDDILFTIESAWGEEDGMKNLELTSLTVTRGTGAKKVDLTKGQTPEFTVDITKTAADAVGNVNTTVKNQKGSTLPSTGGIGTTIFYVIGGILVLIAGVLLVTKRRMNK
ncbi:Cell wall surface anchor family protein [Lachnospiraceae bacterium TWA4]|nr:Cell wall surface anchor family protein [Lachnospiraceae bacterium TWA4]